MIDGAPAGSLQTRLGFISLISCSGLDIGRDGGNPVSHYNAPFQFTSRLIRVETTMDRDQWLDGDTVDAARMARQ